ncbi:MAG TPA: universal stress protein [Candidatus Binataceae bacterium]
MAEQEERRDPESFLGLEAEPSKGKLKVYLGGAAGVGKTYRMLEEARQLRSQGHDVVLGLIEPHQREETAALIGDLEVVPLRQLSYRGATLKEMDLDAILARKPEYVIVDELAHTNAPGSRHSKRYQDVEELLAAGINVITALNVQHLESIAPVVKRISGVEVRETVPDAFLARADQIIDVDISVEALRQRLREGKIYPPEQIENAFRNFFRPANLGALRELALQQVARDQRRKREEREMLKREGGRRPALEERIMVCLSTRPSNSLQLLRKAARAAGDANADWYAVHVETPAESTQKISTRDFRALLDSINLAADMGAEVVWLKGPDVVKALLDFANEKRITRIMVGRTRPSLLGHLFDRSVTRRLIDQARDFDVHVISDTDSEEAP